MKTKYWRYFSYVFGKVDFFKFQAPGWVSLMTSIFLLTNGCSRQYGISDVGFPGQNNASAQAQPTTNPEDGNTGGSNPNSDPSYFFATKELSVENSHTKKVDILFIDDNSASMESIQENMASRFSSLIQTLGGVDYQIAITTTDVSANANLKDGRFISFDGGTGDSSYILKSSSMNINDMAMFFGKTIRRPETGSGFEQGILSLQRTLDRYVDPSADGDKYRDFIRPDAALAVVVISNSNEENQVIRDPQTGTLYGPTDYNKNLIATHKTPLVDRMSRMFPNKAFSWNSIIVIPGDQACLDKKNSFGDKFNEHYGIEYNGLSKQTGGVVGTVCADDYGAQLANLGSHVSQMVQVIPLDCNVEDTERQGTYKVVVYVNGQRLSRDRFVISGRQLKAANGSEFPNGKYRIEYYCPKEKTDDKKDNKKN